MSDLQSGHEIGTRHRIKLRYYQNSLCHTAAIQDQDLEIRSTLRRRIRQARQQQVRKVWSSIGCWNLCGWLYAVVELESWDEPSERLVDRSDRPWDNPDRRPSHNDRRLKCGMNRDSGY